MASGIVVRPEGAQLTDGATRQTLIRAGGAFKAVGLAACVGEEARIAKRALCGPLSGLTGANGARTTKGPAGVGLEEPSKAINAVDLRREIVGLFAFVAWEAKLGAFDVGEGARVAVFAVD